MLAASNAFGEIVPPKVSKQTLQHLKYDGVEEDYQFLYELAVLKALTAKVYILNIMFYGMLIVKIFIFFKETNQ